MGTRSAESAYARTRSPPTLAGRNVPTNVLTKKMRMTRRNGGRASAGTGASRASHRQAIRARSKNVSPIAIARGTARADEATCQIWAG
jgi:hypothetical protein